MTKFEKEARHQLYVFIKKQQQQQRQQHTHVLSPSIGITR